MDFFEAQGRARSLSRRLVLLFSLAVALMIVGVYLVVVVSLGFAAAETGVAAAAGSAGLFQPGLFAGVAAGMLALIGGGSAVRTAQLRRGGPAVAELLGGRRVDPGSRDLAERRLLNVVEEMAIASGVPVPSVYVLDEEPGLNAFAAGHSIHDAAVAVTRGTLDSLDRDELQGVIAHEFSHILNGDMRLNVRLMGVLFGILVLTVVGRGIVRGSYFSGGRRRSSRSGNNGGQIILIGIALIVLGYLGVLFGRLIQAAVSRQREYLADAAAVQFTRNPDGIAGALKKIGGSAAGSRLNDHHAQEAGHLFFSEGVRGAFARSFATHPPLEDRIRKIEPGWDGSYETPERAVGDGVEGEDGRSRSGAGGKSAGPGGVFPFPFPVAGMDAGRSGRASAAAAVVASAGTLESAHLDRARTLLDSVPEELRTATREGDGALAVVLALLLSPDERVRARQEELASQAMGEEVVARARTLAQPVRTLGPAARLPLLELCLPALREIDIDRAEAVRGVVGPLTRADGEVHVFDFALFHLLRRALPGGPDAASAARTGPGLSRRRRETETLLSALAWAGVEPESEARAERAEQAFRSGAEAFGGRGAAALSFRPAASLELDLVDEALGRLETLPPEDRRTLLTALERTVTSDREVTVEERELLRAVAEALDVPMPPLAVQAPSSTSSPPNVSR